MKKLSLIAVFAVSGFALMVGSGSAITNDFGCSIRSSQDPDYSQIDKKCFDAVDYGQTDKLSIMTKVAGKKFSLSLYHSEREECDASNIKYELIDEITGNPIDGTLKSWTTTTSIFDVPNSYKDVKVKFMYDTHWTPVTCAGVTNNISTDDPENGKKYRNYTTNKCYKYSDSTTHREENSSDNFAIIPAHFDIAFKKSSVKEGEKNKVFIAAVNANGSITTNYNQKISNLNMSVAPSDAKVQYLLEDILNGQSNFCYVLFANYGKNRNVTLKDTIYSAIDADDTKHGYGFGPLYHNCRDIIGTSNDVNVSERSKYWAGTGTDKNGSADCPLHTTVQTHVKQNTLRDLRFNKVNW
jgi:hypothetical protein